MFGLRAPALLGVLLVLGCAELPATDTKDSGMVVRGDAGLDASSAWPADADAVSPDAAEEQSDASEPFVDAAQVGADAEQVLADANEHSADASAPSLDANVPPVDASMALFDAATGEDAAIPLDAATPPDAAAPGPDAAVVPPDGGFELCPAYSGASIKGKLPSAVAEASGLAASRAHPGVAYVHNDSGDTARFWAFSLANGANLGEFQLTGAVANDWEDMALGPCPSGTCVFIGDHGDNNSVRTDYAVFRVPEPVVDVGQPVGTVGVTWERLPFTYPGGARYDAETLLVHPVSGDLYVLTKPPDGTPATAYKFPQPLTPGVSATLIQVATLPLPKIGDSRLTAGDIHPAGHAMLLRTYLKLFEVHQPAGQPFDAIFTSTDYRTVPVAAEIQGEAVAWLADGRGYVTVSEGTTSFINVSTCP